MSHHRLQQDAAPSAKPMPAIMMHALRTLFALSLLAMAPAHADTPQQRWVGDLPIMDGMTIEPELGFAFDSPSGRDRAGLCRGDGQRGCDSGLL